ncbi:MAG: hypothetical protein Q8943_17425 [Bacteroidota bacterium]|nr:hypothetical protein [Bacteroidota bacterium]
MLLLKVNPVGIDLPIQQTQQKTYERLLELWGPQVKYDSYGRCYRNKTSTGFVAEVFDGGTEYKEVYADDTLDAISFFGVSDKIVSEAASTTHLHWVFFVNVAQLKPQLAHRGDEEVRQDVLKAFGRASYGIFYQSTEFSIDQVLREYPGSRRDKLKDIDMQPWHCFRLNYKIIFDESKIC